MGAVAKYSLYFSASVVCTASRYICAFSSDQSPLCPHRCLEEAEQLDSRKALLHFATAPLTDRNSMLQFNLAASCLLAADQKL